MTEPVALPELKTHLRLDPDATDEDSDLVGMLLAARRACERHTGLSIVGEATTFAAEDLSVIQRAILVTAASFYRDREGESGLPRAAVWLLEPLVVWPVE